MNINGTDVKILEDIFQGIKEQDKLKIELGLLIAKLKSERRKKNETMRHSHRKYKNDTDIKNSNQRRNRRNKQYPEQYLGYLSNIDNKKTEEVE